MADFKELRQQVSIEKVADWLGINLGPKLRGACPLCEDPRSFTITPVKGLWGCFKCGKKGSILDLVMEMRQVKLPEAGKLIAEAGGALSHALLIKHDSHCQYCYDADSVRYKLQAWEGRK